MKDIVQADPKKNYFLIDGFPRNQDNLEGWNTEMGEKTNLQFVLFFECDEQVMKFINLDSHSQVYIVSPELKCSFNT